MMKRLFSLGMTIALALTAWASTPEEYDFKGLNSEKTINRGESLGFTVNNGSNRTIYSFTIADIEMDLSRFGAFIGGATDGNFTLKTNGLLMKSRILSILNLKNGDKVTIEYKLASETASLTLADATLIGNTADVKTFESGTEYTITTEESSPVHLDIISSSNNNYITKVTVTAPEAESSVSTTVPVAKTGLIYNGEAQELVTAGVADGGTLKYFVSTSSTPPTISSEGWTTDVPQKTDAGTYYVWYYVAANTGNNDSEITAIADETVTIAKATISEVTIANLDAPVKGTTLDTEATCSTAGVENVTIVWKNGDETVSGNAEDNTVYTAVVTLTANSNYVFASQTTANAISEKEGTVTRTDDTHIDVAYTFNATESGTGDEPTTKITVHTIGDSTMSHYDQSVAAQAGMDGWGDYLQDCMKSDWVTVKNWADRGETAKSYYNYYWNGTKPDERPDFTQEINKEVSAGDYVIIQFGHNDSKAYSTVVYEEWMGKLVDAVKEKGATPIIASSICRARFDSDGKITRLGRIDTYEDSGRILEDGATIDDYTFDYPYHAQQVANAKGIEFIDVTSGVKEMFENYGEAKTKALFPSGEKTHTNKLGAQLIAKVAARLLLGTALKNYVDDTTLELPEVDDIDVVIDNFGSEAVVTKKTVWTFNNYSNGDAIAEASTENNVVELNGLYARSYTSRGVNAVTSTISQVTFSDGTVVPVRIAAQTASNHTTAANTIGQNTAGRAAASALAPTFALNVGTPGTFYCILAPTKSNAERFERIIFSGKEVVSVPVATAWSNTDHLCELKYHCETTGVIYLSAGITSNFYAMMFVPDMEAGTEEDWNYQMVKTRENGYWTYTNISGNNQSVPEGLEVYAVSEISSDGKAILSDYGRVIPNGAAVLVKGEANTEYALPSTTDAATYTGENLLVPNTTLRYLPTTESSKTNYYFDGIKFVKATGGETIHEKQAYLSVASESETMPLAILEIVSAPTFTIDGSSVTITGGKSSDAGAVMKTYYQTGTSATAPATTEGTWTEYTEPITMPTTGYVYAYSENTVTGLTSEVVSALVIILKQPIVAYKENKDGKAVYTITSADDNNIKYQLDDEAAVDVEGKTAEISVDKKTTLNAWAYYNDEESSKVSVELLTTPIVETDGVFNFTQLNTENVGDTNVKLEVGGDAVLTVDETPLYKPTITTAATFAGKFAFQTPANANTAVRKDGMFAINKAEGASYYMALLNLTAGKCLTITEKAGTATAKIGEKAITFGQPFEIESTDLDESGNLILLFNLSTGSAQIQKITISDLKLTAPTIALKDITEDKTKSIYSINYNSKDVLHYKIGTDGEEIMPTVATAGTYDVEISASGKLIAWVTRDGAIQSDETSRDVYVPTATVNEGGVYTFKSVKGTTPVELESEEQVFGEQTLYAPTAITATTFEGHFAFSTVTGTDLRLIGGSGLRVAKGKNIYIAIKGLEEGKTLTINYKVGNSADQIAFADAAIIKDAVAEAKVDSGKIYNITADGDILLKVSNANASLDILSVALNQTKTVNKPTISSTYTVNEDSYTYTIHYMEGATLHYTLPGETEQTASEGVSIDVNVTKIGDLTAYATYDGLTSETLTQRVYAPTPSIADNGVYKFAGVSSAMMKDYTLGTIGYGDAVPVGSLTLHKPDAVVSKTLDRFAFAPKLNEKGKNAADWMLLSAGRLRAKSSAMADTLAILDLKKGEYVKITYSGGAELRYMEESTAKLAEGTDLLTSGQGYEILADGILLLTVPANEEKHCDITVISIANEEMVTAPTMALKDGVTNIVRLRQGASSFGKTVTTYFTTDGSKPTSDNGTAVNKSPYDITLDATCTLKALTISETGTKSEITEVTFIVKNETETEEVTELVSIEDDNNATVTAVTIGEETTTVTISANVGDTPVTAIADNVFTATNTANVAAIDLSETQVAMEGERNEIPALMNINQATLVYLPATANVTGTNVVAKTGTGETATYECADFQITDGKESAVPHSFTAASAKLNRTFTADKRCTVCLPYEFKATGGTFYEFTGISSEGKVQMTAKEADSQLSANTPYIFVPNEGLGVISAENVEVSISDAPQTENEEAKFTFIGTFEKLTWTDPSGIYGFAAEDESGATIGQFVRVGSGASIDPCRAYLKYTGNSTITDVAQARSASPEELPAKLEIEWIPASSSVNHNNGDTTSMEDIGQSPEKGSENIYNMHGQRVNGDYKGMVVRNGKKMIKR